MKKLGLFASTRSGPLVELCQNFAVNKNGNIAIAFAVSSVALLSVVGAAIDMSSAHQQKSYLQDTADALVLMAARDDLRTSAQLSVLANDYFAVQSGTLSTAHKLNISVTDFNHHDDQYKLSLSTNMPTRFAGLIGVGAIDINAKASAVYAKRDLDLALVLDNTGSMSGKKLAALKKASNNLIDIVFADQARTTHAPAGHTKVGIVPFASWVNVGTKMKNQPWLDQYGTSAQNKVYFDQKISRFALYQQMNKSWNGCVENRLPPYDVDDTPADPTKPETLYQPAFHPDMADNQPQVYSYLADQTHGSFIKRLRHSSKYKQKLPHWSSGPAKVADSSCSDPRRVVTTLSSNPSHLKKRISAMYAQGYTNIANGTGWGLRLLSPNAPFTQGRAFDGKTNKAMVILTDGEQTMGGQNGPYGSGYSPYGFLGEPVLSGYSKRLDGIDARAALDKKLFETCQAAKKKGVLVYTITFELNHVPTQNMMRNCASTSSHYFDVSNAAALTPVFKKIAAQLGDLRVSQ